jgi:hypothetical protein
MNGGRRAKLVSMLVRFTKRADGRHRLTIVRDDGSACRGQLIRGLGPNAIPHDLLHVVVEKTLGFSRGVYGMVNTGLDIVELLDPAQKRMNKGEAELMYSEIITTVLQADAEYDGLDEAFFGDELRQRCAEAGLAERRVTPEHQRELRRLRDEYRGRWQDLGVGETIDVELPGS